MPRVLVTGANGFVGFEVAKRLLQAGYHVRGTVRSSSKSEEALRREFQDFIANGKCEIVEVADLLHGNLSETLEGCDFVAHVASPFHYQIEDNERDMLRPAIDATVNILKYAKKAAVRRVVLTSSMAAIFDRKLGHCWRNYCYTSADWNPITWDEALSETHAGTVYSASKKFAEEAARKFCLENDLELVTINPPMIYGPPGQPLRGPEDLNTSSINVYRLISGEVASMPEDRVPPLCDVRDVADAHVKALQVEDAKGGRFIIASGSMLWRDVVKHLSESRPELRNRLPQIHADLPPEVRPVCEMDTSPAKTILNMNFIPATRIFEDTVDELLKRQKAGWTY
ncbi:putative cinnamoyl-CoA reductase [Atractiella rhizophila]|nr:putative cinnamoyl-CoA reductase [Atractiella rhizophila]